MSRKSILLLIGAFLATGIAAEVVETKLGKVQGSKGSTKFTGKEYLEFKGIPYGKLPVRFQVSEPAEPWEGVRDGSQFGAKCLQQSFVDAETEGEEDCLFVNVFTCGIDRSNLKPVIVLIHGGSFQFESGADYSPEYMLEEDVVLVTFNFRLGLLGFLSSGEDGVVAGNFGLKDQVLALQWVRDNVEAFGGNPGDVTLLGLSSGAAAVHLHMLSPLSKGLFHKAISMSGTGLMPWVFTRNPEKRLKKIAKLMNCKDFEETNAIKECLQKADVQSLVANTNAFQEWYIDPIVPVGPVVENESEGAFITRFPYEIISKGDYHGKDIPWVLGVNSHEGLLHAADIIHHGMLIRVINVEWDKAAPITLILRHASFDTSKIVEATKEYYFQERDIDNTTIGALVNMYSDRYFYYGTRNAARTHLENGATGKIFLYYFDQPGYSSLIHLSSPLNKNLEGVAHYDQVQYLFKTPDFEELREDQHEFARKFVGRIGEFARSGNVEGWTSVSKSDFDEDKSPVYNVVGSKEEAIPEPFTDRMKFWENLRLYEDKLEFTTGFMESMISKAKEKELAEGDDTDDDDVTVELVNDRIEL